jgi:hypothetical protein
MGILYYEVVQDPHLMVSFNSLNQQEGLLALF